MTILKRKNLKKDNSENKIFEKDNSEKDNSETKTTLKRKKL